MSTALPVSQQQRRLVWGGAVGLPSCYVPEAVAILYLVTGRREPKACPGARSTPVDAVKITLPLPPTEVAYPKFRGGSAYRGWGAWPFRALLDGVTPFC